jgi:UDP-GlcNAc3NAcA epimerase
VRNPLKIVSVVGARPQFIKAAAFERAIDAVAASDDLTIEHHLVHTGQHYDRAMSDTFFEELLLSQPFAHLGVGSASHGAQTGEMLRLVEPVLQELSPDVVVVFGDTNSTLAGALAAVKLQLPVAHVEAGLRSFNRDMPEEINRVVVDHLSTLLLCPSAGAVSNLRLEGITDGVHLVGDLMYDALLASLPNETEQRHILGSMGLAERGYALATLHRAANTDDRERLVRLMRGLDLVCDSGLPVVLPMHPRTRSRLGALTSGAGTRIIEPLGHRETLALAANARVVLTDSGGLQKEALWLRVPCVTLREETEWPETVDTGWNRLVSADPVRIRDAALSPIPDAPPALVYGTVGASGRVVDILTGEFRSTVRSEANVG